MVCRPVADHRLGGLSGGVRGHDRQTARTAYLCRQLVLPQLHHHHRDAPYRQQPGGSGDNLRSEEHTSELQSLMRISYAVFCLKKKKTLHKKHTHTTKTTL